ncbi:MAG: four helix bundle protein [Arcicella sp.]|nr:four helix bundle protein [Arcicella sp.]
MQSFFDLEVWKKSKELKKKISTLVKTFPLEEKYRLTDQIIRSSRSVTANISEGYGKYTYKETKHFCIHARGSLNETLNHLIDAFDEEYITKEQLLSFKNEIEECLKLLNGYISYLKKKMDEKSPIP